MNRLRKVDKEQGFTIVELLVTIVIVSIMASVAFPMAGLVAQRNKEQELRRNLREIRTALDMYKKAVDDGRIVISAGDSGYPPSLEILQTGIADIKDPSSGKLYFLRHVPRDPLRPDMKGPAAAMWGKRSYASSADDPQEGRDVYDVYSLSEGTGLNGVPYREW